MAQGVDGPPPPMPSYLVWYLKPDGTQGFARTAEGRGPEQINFGWTPKMEQQLVKEFEDRQQAAEDQWALDRYKEIYLKQREWDLRNSSGMASSSDRPVVPKDIEDAVRRMQSNAAKEALDKSGWNQDRPIGIDISPGADMSQDPVLRGRQMLEQRMKGN